MNISNTLGRESADLPDRSTKTYSQTEKNSRLLVHYRPVWKTGIGRGRLPSAAP